MQQTTHALRLDVLSLHGKADLAFLGLVPQIGGNVPAQSRDVHLLPGQGVPLVQLGQTDDVADEGHQPLGLPADVAHEPGQVLLLHQSVFNQLGAADDPLKGGL